MCLARNAARPASRVMNVGVRARPYELAAGQRVGIRGAPSLSMIRCVRHDLAVLRRSVDPVRAAPIDWTADGWGLRVGTPQELFPPDQSHRASGAESDVWVAGSA